VEIATNSKKISEFFIHFDISLASFSLFGFGVS